MSSFGQGTASTGRSHILGSITASILALGLVASSASAQQIGEFSVDCASLRYRIAVPQYEIVKGIDHSSDPPHPWLHVVVSQKHSRIEDLIVLGRQLNRDFAERQGVTISIFDHRNSAKAWAPGAHVFDVKDLRDPRATYFLYREKTESYLTWAPDPTRPSRLVRINLTNTLPPLGSTRDLEQFVGTYPCDNGLLEDPVLLRVLQDILGREYHAYREHAQFSGCGPIERRSGFLLMNVSQLHVGGYSSLIFVRLEDGMLFVFWLKSTVAEKLYQFYGPRPIPETVTQIVETEMNEAWGHVAQFEAQGEELKIELRKKRGGPPRD